MNIAELSKPLTADDIDFRVQSVVGRDKKYAIILAYKDARVDMRRLDEVVGSLNWQRKHCLIGQHLHCEVSIFNETTGQWVSKSDVGTESNAEATKGEASDSFKRACFNWGIGRELYGYPLIMVQLNSDEFQITNNKVHATNKLRPQNWRWELQSATDGTVLLLKATDDKGNQRFHYTANKTQKQSPQQEKPQQKLPYPDDRLAANINDWKERIASGEINVGKILTGISSEFILSPQQTNIIRGLAK